ncbi:MAG: hypothetical protein J3K34DRAFT_492458 [Monoraphidium minutum]|nr:MAG: hypothetical protein J3K34DRAFT_492458 [Monoraphidium minutum]
MPSSVPTTPLPLSEPATPEARAQGALAYGMDDTIATLDAVKAPMLGATAPPAAGAPAKPAAALAAFGAAAPAASSGDGATSMQLANALKLLEPGLQGLSLATGHAPPPAAPGLAPPAAERPRRVTFGDAPPGAPGAPPGPLGVDAAKRAVGAALAGLDLQTARVNLDASKAAVNAMRASGELPVHPPRKPAARSASARQLNYTGASANAPPLRHNLPLGAGPGGGGGGGGGIDDNFVGLRGSGAAAAAGLGRSGAAARRLPPGRSISMPYVMHGRAGMQARLGATLAQDASLQQQLQLLQQQQQQQQQQGGGSGGGPGGGPAGPGGLQLLQAGMLPQAGGLQHSQQLQLAPGAPGGWGEQQGVRMGLLPQGGGPPGLGAGGLDDATLLQLAGGVPQVQWAPAAAQQVAMPVPQQVAQPQVLVPGGWAPVASQGAQLQAAQMQQLLAAQQQQQQQQQAAAAAAAAAAQQSAALDALWGPAHGAQLPMPSAAPPPGAAPAPPGAGGLDPAAALESYSSSSWQVLALAHAGGAAAARSQLAQELSLLAAACGALGALGGPDAGGARAVPDLSLVAAAAQQHLAAHAGLSAPAALAVQLLAGFVAPLCHARGSTQPNKELLEASFLMLDTLAAANHDASAAVAAAYGAARAAPHVVGAGAEVGLLKRQATARQALAALAGFVERNQQLLLTMSSSAAAAHAHARHAHGAAAAGRPGSGGALSAPGGPGSPGSSAQLSPVRDTPLASFFANAPGSGPLDGLDAASAGAAAGHFGGPAGHFSPPPVHYSPLAGANSGALQLGGGLPHLAASMPLA